MVGETIFTSQYDVWYKSDTARCPGGGASRQKRPTSRRYRRRSRFWLSAQICTTISSSFLVFMYLCINVTRDIATTIALTYLDVEKKIRHRVKINDASTEEMSIRQEMLTTKLRSRMFFPREKLPQVFGVGVASWSAVLSHDAIHNNNNNDNNNDTNNSNSNTNK